jgi:hypothetical protein
MLFCLWIQSSPSHVSLVQSFGSRRLSGASYKGEVAVDIDGMGDREEDEDQPLGCMASVLRVGHFF